MKLYLRDNNSEVTAAWRAQFADLIASSRVEVSYGDIFEAAPAEGLVSPANSFGFMDGGIDAVYLLRFGFAFQDRVRAVIENEHAGELPVGSAVIVPTDDKHFPNLVVAPTMRVPGDVSGTVNAYLATRAALAISVRAGLRSVLCPGLATAIGETDPTIAARQMRLAWDNVIDGRRVHSLEQGRKSQGALRGLRWALEE
jgi:O-acetyl-ADP-ribose deacetylase (regulator of RNase III)